MEGMDGMLIEMAAAEDARQRAPCTGPLPAHDTHRPRPAFFPTSTSTRRLDVISALKRAVVAMPEHCPCS